jgi:subtilisin-like proprotein convertase family protein
MRVLAALSLTLAGSASAATISQSWSGGFAGGGAIPDNNPVGWTDTRTLSGITATTITDVNVRLSLTGGFNGDLYAYLQHTSGISILLNRPGKTATDAFGYGDSGMNVTFDDAAAGDIHNYQLVGGSILGGASWQPDGRAVSPLTVVDTSPRTAMLSGFNGLNPNGTWTLFVADLSGGAVSTVASWGLEISAVPEPGQSVGTMLLLSSALMLRIRPRRA